MKKWTIGRKLLALAVLNFVILSTVSGLSNMTLFGLTKQIETLGKVQIPAIRAMGLTDMLHDGIRAVVLRAFVATYQKNAAEFSESVKEYDEFSTEIRGYLKQIEGLDVSEKTKRHVADGSAEVEDYVKSGHGIIALLEAGKLQEAEGLQAQFQSDFKELEAKLEVLGETIETETAAAMQNSSESAVHAGIAFAVIGAIIALFVSFLLNRSLVSVLARIVASLDEQKSALEGYTVKIDDSAQGLSSSTSEQASAMLRTSSAVEEINSMVDKTSHNSKTLSESSTQSNEVVQQGRTLISQMLTEMGNIRGSNNEVMNQIEQSNQQIRDIVQVINNIAERTKIINDIVFQTKLLSFNASVEAARAGEHGKGFAVVAQEVGNLAQVSGNAAKEISDMLQKSIEQVTRTVETNKEKVGILVGQNAEKVNAGEAVVNECDKVFAQIVNQVEEVRKVSGEISLAINEQSIGLNEITQAINLFSTTTQANSNSAQVASGVASDLRTQFDSMSELLEELVGLVGAEKTQEYIKTAAREEEPMPSFSKAA